MFVDKAFGWKCEAILLHISNIDPVAAVDCFTFGSFSASVFLDAPSVSHSMRPVVLCEREAGVEVVSHHLVCFELGEDGSVHGSLLGRAPVSIGLAFVGREGGVVDL